MVVWPQGFETGKSDPFYVGVTFRNEEDKKGAWSDELYFLL